MPQSFLVSWKITDALTAHITSVSASLSQVIAIIALLQPGQYAAVAAVVSQFLGRAGA